MNLTFDDDGEFYMSLADFVQKFEDIDICNMASGKIDDDDNESNKLVWHESKINGQWIEGLWDRSRCYKQT